MRRARRDRRGEGLEGAEDEELEERELEELEEEWEEELVDDLQFPFTRADRGEVQHWNVMVKSLRGASAFRDRGAHDSEHTDYSRGQKDTIRQTLIKGRLKLNLRVAFEQIGKLLFWTDHPILRSSSAIATCVFEREFHCWQVLWLLLLRCCMRLRGVCVLRSCRREEWLSGAQ